MIRALKLLVGSGFGSGYLPKFPGTWGSLFALIPIYFIFHSQNALIYLVIFIAISSVLNLWVSDTCEEHWGEDPGKMVIDEWSGRNISNNCIYGFLKSRPNHTFSRLYTF